MPKVSATAGYFKRLVSESRNRAWNIVFADRPVTVILAWSVTCLTIFLQRRFTHASSDQVRDALMSVGFGLITYGFVFGLTFLFQFCYFAPKQMVKSLEAQRAASQSEQDSIKARDRLSAYLHQIEESIANLRSYHTVEALIFDEKDKEQKLGLIGEIADYITQNWGFSDAAEFMSDTGFVSNAKPIDHYEKTVEVLQWRAKQLKELLIRYKTNRNRLGS